MLPSGSLALAEDYTAEAMGKNDVVKVTVTYADGKIEAVSAEHAEAPGLGDSFVFGRIAGNTIADLVKGE